MTIILILSLLANVVLGAYLWLYVRRVKALTRYAEYLEESLRAQFKGMLIGGLVGIGAVILRRIFSANDGSGEYGT